MDWYERVGVAAVLIFIIVFLAHLFVSNVVSAIGFVVVLIIIISIFTTSGDGDGRQN